MTTNELQRPTVSIDKKVWEIFTKEVGKRRGYERKALREELENALYNYVNSKVSNRIKYWRQKQIALAEKY